MKILTVRELSEILKVKSKTLYQGAELNQIPCMKLNSCLRFDFNEILKWLQNCKKQPQLSYNSFTQARGPRKGGITKMGLYHRGKTFWFSIQYQGKKIQQSLKTDNKKLAEKLYAKVLTEIIEDRYFEAIKAKQYTFDKMMTRFMEEHAVKREVSTQKRYLISLKSLNGHFKGMTLAEITPKVISAYIEARKNRGIATATINRDIAMLSKAFNLAVKQWEWCKENPCSRIQREPENNQIDRWLTPEEEQRTQK